MEREVTTKFFEAKEKCQVCLITGVAYTNTRANLLETGVWTTLEKGQSVTHPASFTLYVKD
jgi:hypothetical protein